MTTVLFLAALVQLVAGLEVRANGHKAMAWVLVLSGAGYALTGAVVEIARSA